MSGPWEQYADPSTAKQEEGPWSQFAVAEAADIQAKKQLSTFDYISNEAKKGTVDSAVLGQAILDTFVVDPFKMVYEQYRSKSLSDLVAPKTNVPTGGIAERFGKNIERLQKATQPLTGARYDTKAPSITAEILGGGARFVTDPLGLFSGTVKAGATAAEAVTKTGKEIAGRVPALFGIGVTAETGGQLGEAAEKAVTGEDTGAGRAIGSIAAATKGATFVAPAVSTVVNAPFNVIGQVYKKYKTVQADPNSASEVLATTSAKRLLEAIAKETPGNKLDEIVDDFNRISGVVNKENLPLLVAMSDNPLVRVSVQRLAKTNPEMRQRIETELGRLAQNIDNRADLIFGQRYAPVVGAEQVSVKNAVKQRIAIDNKINQLSEAYIPGVTKENIGSAITNLVDSRVKLARKEMEPVYTSVLADAKKAGATLPETAVKDVYNFVVSNNIRDIFGKGTAVDKKIIKEWGPTEIGFAPAGFEQVDSLKREINRLQRGRLNPDESRKLFQLEDVLDNARAQIPGNFNDRLKAADLAYYEKVGVPFGSQGIKDIDSKKYAEQVAPVIIKNTSSLRQFLTAVGDEGKPIVRNAIISDAYSKVFTNDALDPKKLQTYLTRNKEILDQVPDVQAELRNAIVDVGSLQVARKNIDLAVAQTEKELADNFVIRVKDSKGVSVPDYKSITDRTFRDPAFFSKIKKDISNLDPSSAKAVTNAMRAEIINTARDFPDGGLSFLSNPRNKRVIDGVFGSGYQSAVKDLVKLSDAVNRSDVGKLSAVITQADLDTFGKYAANLGFPGLDIPYVTSTIRDRISSPIQKAVRVITKVNTAKTREDTDQAIFDLLFDKDGLKKLQQVSKEFDLIIQNPVTLKKITDKIQDVIPLYTYGAVKAATIPSEEGPISEQFPMGGFEEDSSFTGK